MSVYEGEVSHKKGLGKTRMVTATDNLTFALAFGVSGSIGQFYSNQKIGMLELLGEGSHAEVAVNPMDMARLDELEFAKSHPHAVVSYPALATALEYNYGTELQYLTKSINPTWSYQTLTDNERSKVIKVLLGEQSIEEVRAETAGNDESNGTERLSDSLKRLGPSLVVEREGQVGGVPYRLTARGTTSFKITDNAQVVTIRARNGFSGQVLGNASAAGTKYRDQFKAIKEFVTDSKAYRIDHEYQYSKSLSTPDVLEAVRGELLHDLNAMIEQAQIAISGEFEELEPYNPAGAKAALWRELNLTVGDVPQTRLDEKALRAYADQEITALQFADMPENGLVEKINKAVVKRLDTADVDAITEQKVDLLIQNRPKADREQMTAQVRALVQKSLGQLADQLGNAATFSESYENYRSPNQQLVDKVLVGISADDIVADERSEAKGNHSNQLRLMLAERVQIQYHVFLHKNNIDSPFTHFEIIDDVVDDYYGPLKNDLETYYDFNSIDEVMECVQTVSDDTLQKAMDRRYPVSQVMGQARADILTQYAGSLDIEQIVDSVSDDFAGMMDLYHKYCQTDNSNTNEETTMEIDQATVSDLFSQALEEQIAPVVEDFKVENKITPGSVFDQSGIAEGIAQREADMGLDDLQAELKETSEEPNEAIPTYVQENYDRDYLYMKVENMYDLEDMMDDARNELVLELDNTEAYASKVDDWRPYVQRVTEVSEMMTYLKDADGLPQFVETYAPEALN
ncbi:hypothetical protein [Lactiplantibacillus plantarum]|uniref:hypothetical protein n=1 Tax=Lactiplantibacillus plantarum TaxID=1590 RepID=UPI001BA9C9CE|nr:hypothetical protein [Lactiplantibacillus plantarum]MBS0936610.1 hypothetical protein [Lactiplantibacillus plantarum]MBS0943809.1 hypothetical protein [Lactiplantibacillus plantarum]